MLLFQKTTKKTFRILRLGKTNLPLVKQKVSEIFMSEEHKKFQLLIIKSSRVGSHTYLR